MATHRSNAGGVATRTGDGPAGTGDDKVRITLAVQADVAALEEVYRRVHADDLHLTDHSDPPARQRLEWTVRAPGFAAALGYAGDRLVGALLGAPLPPETQWWRDLRSEHDPELVREWPGRTFALCEAFVLPEFRRRQLGLRLLDALLSSRSEQRVSLAVAVTNTGVFRTVQMRGWEHVGNLLPFPGWRPHGMFLRPLPWHRPLPPASRTI